MLFGWTVLTILILTFAMPVSKKIQRKIIAAVRKKRNIEIVKLEDVNVNLREMYLSNQRYVVKYDVYPSDAEDLDLEFIALDKNIKVEKTDKNGKKSIIDEENQNHLFFEKAKMKRGSLVDRYIFKIANPDGVIEDYITEGDKPGDKYKRFKNQLIKGKNKIYKLIQDVKRTQMISDTMLGVYITKLKGKKYNNNKEV